eukprot:PhM_4_TR8396/c6_g5_i14/m.62495
MGVDVPRPTNNDAPPGATSEGVPQTKKRHDWRLQTLNVCSICDTHKAAAIITHAYATESDIFVLTETRRQEDADPLHIPDGYQLHETTAAHAGLAVIISPRLAHEITTVTVLLPGRMLKIATRRRTFIAVYMPTSQHEHEQEACYSLMQAHVTKHTFVIGDLNSRQLNQVRDQQQRRAHDRLDSFLHQNKLRSLNTNRPTHPFTWKHATLDTRSSFEMSFPCFVRVGTCQKK